MANENNEIIKTYSVSVRELAETMMLTGSIDNRYVSRGRMAEGVRLHKYMQKHYGEQDAAELTVKTSLVSDDGICLEIGGRIDGVRNIGTRPVVEEIKSTRRDPDFISEAQPAHLAQCELYAYIFAKLNELTEIDMRVTYIHVSSKNIKSFEYTKSFAELQSFFDEITSGYLDFLRFRLRLEKERDASLASLEFPFGYRRYQKEIISSISDVIASGKNVFINAPTGTGKTLDALFPALKALPTLRSGHIFYLTAKSTQKDVAAHALELLYRRSGLKLKGVIITAKEKACMLPTPACNPEDCEYAKDYYDKLKGLVEKIAADNELITREIIMKYAEECKVCPFELGLDLTGICDVIICDYNYVFDPAAALKRFFDTDAKTDNIFLIDEAHNLSDRSRDMYSAALDKSTVLRLKRELADVPQLASSLGKINTILLSLSKKADESGVYIAPGPDAQLLAELSVFQFEADRFLGRAPRGDDAYRHLLDFYFDTVAFTNIAALMGEAHTVYYDAKENFLKLFCTDAREYLRDCLAKGRSAVFFSATLTPLDYYCELLGGSKNDYVMNVKSIFPQDNFKIAIDRSIQTTYEKRAMYYGAAADRIHRTVNHERGNYIVYFPSYAYMDAVYMAYCEKYGGEDILMQRRSMTEEERGDFIASFTDFSCVCAFAVAGGVFAEAIDLTGNKLIGCIICGVSLPMICTERELIRKHYDAAGRSGFDYAYVYPAMNKVLQAMGRVIRTVDDRGTAVLLDARFTYPSYRKCFPPQYGNMAIISGGEQLEAFFNYEGDWGA